MPDGRDSVVTLRAVFITIEQALLAVCEPESFTVNVKVYDPAVVGVPLKTPALKVRPGGNVPAVWDQV